MTELFDQDRYKVTTNDKVLGINQQIKDITELLCDGKSKPVWYVRELQNRIHQLEWKRTRLLREPSLFKRTAMRFRRSRRI